MSRRSISAVSFLRLAATFAASAGAVSTSFLGCGASDALVGGECGAGFAQCDYACVDLASDMNNCGACGNTCPAGSACIESSCTIRNGASPSGTPSSSGGNSGDGASAATPEDGGVSPSVQRDAGDGAAPSTQDGSADAARDGRGPGDDGSTPNDAAAGASDGRAWDDAQSGSDDASSDDASVADAPAQATADDAGGSGPDGGPSDDAPSFVATTSDDASADAPAEDAATQCVPPFDTTQQCGDCYTVCSGVNDACMPNGSGGFACAPLCAAPLTECNGQCFDERTDPNNCGTCGKICPSNLCASSLCEGETPGDAIVLGHDYATTLPGTAQARALSNAVFLPSSNPVRILSFEQYADAGSVASVKAILAAAAAAQGKAISLTISVNGTDIPNSLDISTYDTLLVYDQAEAPPGALGPLGTSWAGTIITFLGAGGDVVALDGAAGTTGEMPELESNAGILDVLSHTQIPAGTPLAVSASGDSVALGVLSPYGATTSSAHFLPLVPTGEAAAYVVVEPVSGEPVVVHRTVSGGGN